MRRLAIPIFLCLSTTVQGGFIFETVNDPQPDQENILLSSGASGTSIFGQTNQSGFAVEFQSAIDTLLSPSNGQSRIEALDGRVNNVSITVPNGFFQGFIGNLFDGSGTATITAVANEPGGGTILEKFQRNLSKGQNFFTLVATNGETLQSVTIDAADGFSDLRQARISGADPPAVPEPGTLTLLAGCAVAFACPSVRARLFRRPGRST